MSDGQVTQHSNMILGTTILHFRLKFGDLLQSALVRVFDTSAHSCPSNIKRLALLLKKHLTIFCPQGFGSLQMRLQRFLHLLVRGNSENIQLLLASRDLIYALVLS